MTPEAARQVSDLINENNTQIVGLEFNDLPGLWQHFSMPPSELTEMDTGLRRNQRGHRRQRS